MATDLLDRDYEPDFALSFGRAVARISRVWFRYRMQDAYKIPVAGPVLFVGNHSGIGIVDVLCILGAWAERYEGKRRGVGMMHKMFVGAPLVGATARRFGAVPADPANARAAIARGLDVACFPGGDLDACRPFTAARSVEFGDRRGYVKLALETGVPIVPIATLGSHRTYTLLPGGSTIARITGMKRWARCERFPLVLGTVIAFAVLALVVASLLPWWSLVPAVVAMLVPNPARVTTLVLDPIDLAAATARLDDPKARIEEGHRLVHGALARALATMQHPRE